MFKALASKISSAHVPLIVANPVGEFQATHIAHYIDPETGTPMVVNATRRPFSPISGARLKPNFSQTEVLSAAEVAEFPKIGVCAACDTEHRTAPSLAKQIDDGFHCIVCGSEVKAEIDPEELKKAEQEEAKAMKAEANADEDEDTDRDAAVAAGDDDDDDDDDSDDDSDDDDLDDDELEDLLSDDDDDDEDDEDDQGGDDKEEGKKDGKAAEANADVNADPAANADPAVNADSAKSTEEPKAQDGTTATDVNADPAAPKEPAADANADANAAPKADAAQAKVEVSALKLADLKQGQIDLAYVEGADPYYYVFHNTKPIATLRQSKAAPEIAKLFASDSVSNGFVAAAQAGLSPEDAARFGVEPIVVQVPVDQAVQNAIEEKVAEQTASAKAAYAAKEEAISQSLSIAALQIIKGLSEGTTNPLRDGLIEAMEKTGVKNPEGIVDQCLAKHGVDFLKLTLSKANELAEQSVEARNAVARVVETAGFRSTASGKSVAEEVAATLSEGSVRLAAHSEGGQGADRQESTASNVTTFDRTRQVLRRKVARRAGRVS